MCRVASEPGCEGGEGQGGAKAQKATPRPGLNRRSGPATHDCVGWPRRLAPHPNPPSLWGGRKRAEGRKPRMKRCEKNPEVCRKEMRTVRQIVGRLASGQKNFRAQKGEKREPKVKEVSCRRP